MAAPPSVYGYGIDSDLPLRRLLPEPGPRGTLRLRRATAPLVADGGTVVHILESPDRFVLTRVGERLHVDCSASGQFLVDPPELLLAAPSDCAADLWEHRVLTTALPLLLSERGDVVVHGAALAAGERAVLLAGTTGRGKSTTALTAGSLGHRLLGEDGAAVDLSGPEVVVWPGPRGVRVAPAVAESLGVEAEPGPWKRTVFLPEAAHAREPLPLAAIVVLGERGAALTLEPVDPAAALPLVLPHLIYGGSDRLPAAFSQCARLVERVAVLRCSLPEGLGLLGPALEELLARVSGAAAPVRR